MSPISVEAVTKTLVLGEGPHWDSRENVLYFVDIVGKQVHKYDPATKRETFAKIDGVAVSFIIPVQDQNHKFLVGIGHHICLMTWDGESEKPSSIEKLVGVDEEEEKQKNQLNDGKADASGRLWTGTVGEFTESGVMTPHQGSLYNFSNGKAISKQVEDITCSNGMAWSPDNQTFYYIDTFSFKVDAFDCDIKIGQLSKRRTVFDFKTNNVSGMPDGMTIDTNGNIWVACFNGSQVIQIDPKNGKLLQSVPIPSPQVTSVAFGGTNLDELYVTSGSFNLSPELKAEFPSAGCTYCIKGINAKGVSMYNVKL